MQAFSATEKTEVQPTVERVLPESYLAMIRGSVGTKMFQRLFARVDGELEDILKEGELSCAYFVSNVLLIHKLIKEGHATVISTVKDIERSGWYKVKKPRDGAVIVWGATIYPDGRGHRHIGFYVGGEQAISNSTSKGVPKQHDWKYRDDPRGERTIEAIYWNDMLNE